MAERSNSEASNGSNGSRHKSGKENKGAKRLAEKSDINRGLSIAEIKTLTERETGHVAFP